MKHLGKITFGVLTTLLAACSSEEPMVPSVPEAGQQDVYASLTLRLPSGGTRAGNNGEEFGQSYENSVGKIYVVLATKDADGTYKYLTSAQTDAKPNNSDVPANTVKYVLNFSSGDMDPNPLDKPAPDGGENGGSGIPGTQGVYVFAYCNPSATLVGILDNLSKGDTFTNQEGTITDGYDAEMWQKNKFLMTNCEIPAPVEIPTRNDLIENYGTPENPLNLGTVKVKRAAARFDFMTTTIKQEWGPNVYEITDIDGETVVGKVELTDMAMFNVAKKFYYLPRTSNTWAWKAPYNLCGDLEGFVVSPGSFRNIATLNKSDGDNFFSYLIRENNATQLKWTSISHWNNAKDDDNGWNAGIDGEGNEINSNTTDYRIWRYTTENTIPASTTGSATGSQKIGITTGVVFRGVFNPVNTQRWNGNAVYVHDNVVYGDFNALKDYVKKYPETIVAADFAKIEEFTGAGDLTAEELRKSLIGADNKHGFKVYEPTYADAEYKYYMYYFYYNRHNTNYQNSVLGNNEFGVVRNNVYKLRVTKVGTFGEPNFPDDPNELDEQESAYFTVSCLVMPWTVRVNDIEF